MNELAVAAGPVLRAADHNNNSNIVCLGALGFRQYGKQSLTFASENQ